VNVASEQRPRVLNPSRISPWHGTAAAGSRWSIEQIETLKAERRDPDTVSTAWITLMVHVGGDRTRAAVPRDLLVPALARTRRGNRALIVTPGGSKIWKDIK
jgi:hypothetical protein